VVDNVPISMAGFFLWAAGCHHCLGLRLYLNREEADEIMLLAGFPPIGRGILHCYRQDNRKKGDWGMIL
jgi:hypothetical protein